MVFSFLKPPQFREHNEDSRHATWLELFFDLVLVAAIAQVGHTLVTAETLADAARYLGLAWIVFWVWCGHTIYSTRFDTDDPLFRVLTFLNMFALIVMAVEVHSAAHGHGLIFGMAFLASRLVLLVLMGRAYGHVPAARPILKVYLLGFGLGAAIWAGSLFLHGEAVYKMWMLALAIEAAVPWIIWRMPQDTKHVSSEHIPERFGLFTIIVLGENIFAVVKGLEPLEWTMVAAQAAALSFIIAASIWWIYFQHIERMIGHIKLGSGQPYIYSHFPLLVGIVAVGIGTLRLITETGQPLVSTAALMVVVGGYTLWWFGGVLLHFISCPVEARSKTAFARNITIAALLASVAYYGPSHSALAIVAMICTISLVYALWDGIARSRSGTSAET